jgi:hypothetical protein
VRSAAAQAVLDVVDKRRQEWVSVLSDLKEELAALLRSISLQNEKIKSLPKKWSDADRSAGLDQEARRQIIRLESRKKEAREYGEYVNSLSKLLQLTRDRLLSSGMRVKSLLPERVMGDANSIFHLQNYVVGLAPAGIKMRGDGSLDTKESFRRIDYFSLLEGIRVRINVQGSVGTKPVDFIAPRIPREAMTAALPAEDRPDEDVIWLYGDETHQGLILSRSGSEEALRLRYLPVCQLHQDEAGVVRFEFRQWGDGLPLRLWEDPDLIAGPEGRDAWLNDWHTDTEWLAAAHRCVYANAVIGLNEHFRRFVSADLPAEESEEEALLRRFEQRRRRMAEADFLVFASNHWNFNVRGFNPGGNHGSVLRTSTHSTLLLAGAGIPQGLQIEKPYDSLSFAPTLLRLTGRKPATNGHKLPGPVIEELFSPDTGP